MDENTDAAQVFKKELPKYKCKKIVHALKIVAIVFDSDEAAKDNRETDGSAIITPEDGYPAFKVDHEYVSKRLPPVRDGIVGGYFVVYEDGYASFSPRKAFENGYERMND